MTEQPERLPAPLHVPGLSLPSMEHLAQIVSQILASHGWSARQAAGRMGLSEAEMSRLRHAQEPNPKVATLLTIQRVAGIPTLEALFGDPPSRTIIRELEGGETGVA
jgi:transcriptional regulator with XRE-family HTH domain